MVRRVLPSALVLALALPAATLHAQRACAEAFDTTGIRAHNGDAEQQLFTILKVHKKGDLTDATRIHMMLAQYHAEHGDSLRSVESKRRAGEAWTAAEAKATSSGDPKDCATPTQSAKTPGEK